VLIGGSDYDDAPDRSPDGTRIAFWRGAGAGTTLMGAVADGSDVMGAVADGSDVQPLATDPVRDASGYWWSSDGTQLIMTTAIDGRDTVSLVAADGSGVTPLDLGFAADEAIWRPDRKANPVRTVAPEEPASSRSACRTSRSVNRSRRPIPKDPCMRAYRGALHFQWAIHSADGSLLQYTAGTDDGDGKVGVFGGTDTRNFVMDADGSNQRMIEFDPTSDYEDGAWFSPDGTRLSMIIRKGDTHQVAIMTLDGSKPLVATEAVVDSNAMPAIWSPDGTQLLSVRIADGVSDLIDPDTGATTLLPWHASPASSPGRPVATWSPCSTSMGATVGSRSWTRSCGPSRRSGSTRPRRPGVRMGRCWRSGCSDVPPRWRW